MLAIELGIVLTEWNAVFAELPASLTEFLGFFSEPRIFFPR